MIITAKNASRQSMKKILAMLIGAIILFGGLGAAAVSTNFTKNASSTTCESVQVLFPSQPSLSEKDGFLAVGLKGATTTLSEPTRPELPIYVHTFELPFGSTHINVTCTPRDISTMTLSKEVVPTRVAPLSKMSERTAFVQDPSVYNSASSYPACWYTTDLGAGRNHLDQEVVFVKLICYPVRYSPQDSQLTFTSGFDVTLSYNTIATSPRAAATWDMVIIAPKAFKATLQPLIDFKNSKGLRTTFMSMEDILAQYHGADPPEQIKLFIYHAYNTTGIKYVLLVGGLKNHLYANDKEDRSFGSKAWWVPVRYVNIPQEDDEECLCDLYYGCLVNATGGFDSWDSNGDGIYAAWDAGSSIPNDDFDMNPEVYVSRLPVTHKMELSRVVNKIITYESTGPTEKSWFSTMVAVGGKTFENYSGQPDGEYLCDLALHNMSSLISNPLRVYSSNRLSGGLVPIPEDIVTAFSLGGGFVDFEGHGNPNVWDTIWYNGTYPEDWCGGVSVLDFHKFTNFDRLPVVVVGGCHNGLYNISMIPSLIDRNGSQYFTYGVPTPVCFSWGLVMKNPGGAIASTGCTGYGMSNDNTPVSLSGELENNFFYEIGQNGSMNLGKAHGQAIHDFLAKEPIGQVEAFCITDWALFGDPSLRLGGYES
jgi:hypothetical protein